MNIKMERWYLDFSEKGQMWHHDLKRVPENENWVNIGYGNKLVLNHFCDIVDVLTREFGMNFTADQIIRLAECTPGLTVYNNTEVPEDSFDADVHMSPIWAREQIEKNIEWKPVED